MYHSGFAYWNWESTEFSNLFIVFFWIFIFAAIPCWPNEHYLRVKALELFWGYLCIYWQIDLGKSIVIFIYLLALAASIICLFFSFNYWGLMITFIISSFYQKNGLLLTFYLHVVLLQSCISYLCSLQVEIQVRKLYCINRAMPNLPINIEDAARSEKEFEKAELVSNVVP